MYYSIIAAVDQKNGIGINNNLPWNLKADLKHFAGITIGLPRRVKADHKKNAVIMGLNTWISLPEKYRPLRDRLNVVLSKKTETKLPEGVLNYQSLETALEDLGKKDIDEAFIIGGGMLYTYAIKQPACNKLYLTHILKTFDCDIFFPEIPANFKKIKESEVQEENGIQFKFVVYEK